MKDFIWSDQGTLFDGREAVGFGCDDLWVREISRDRANALIQARHYSGTIVGNSRWHFGVFDAEGLCGALQYGPAMNPASGGSVVEGTDVDGYLELNRMWVDDRAPRNSESRAISYTLKVIRRRDPRIAWIQSFADERCGGLGIVYQAANFGFYGEHRAVFWELDGVTYHNIHMTTRNGRSPMQKMLQERRDEATRVELRQFRYLFFLRRSAEGRCLLSRQTPPKHYATEAA